MVIASFDILCVTGLLPSGVDLCNYQVEFLLAVDLILGLGSDFIEPVDAHKIALFAPDSLKIRQTSKSFNLAENSSTGSSPAWKWTVARCSDS